MLPGSAHPKPGLGTKHHPQTLWAQKSCPSSLWSLTNRNRGGEPLLPQEPWPHSHWAPQHRHLYLISSALQVGPPTRSAHPTGSHQAQAGPLPAQTGPWGAARSTHLAPPRLLTILVRLFTLYAESGVSLKGGFEPPGPTPGLSPAGDLDGTGERWEAWSSLPAAGCQREEEEEEAEGLDAFHLYLLGQAPSAEDAADLLGLASGAALSCGFCACSAVPEGALHAASAAALGLRALRAARGLLAEAATHL